MSTTPHRLGRLVWLAGFLFSMVASNALMARGDPQVIYTQPTKTAEGDSPLTETYTLGVVSPLTPFNGPATVSMGVSLETGPAGVSAAEAVSYISVNPAQLVYTGPQTSQTISISINVPAGVQAGNYTFRVFTSGWASGVGPVNIVDVGHYINMTVLPPRSGGEPPSVGVVMPTSGALYSYTLGLESGVDVPVSIQSNSAVETPILDVSATISGQPIANLTTTGLGTAAATSSSVVRFTAAGLYTVRATAVNAIGSSTATTDFTVEVLAPPPVVVINSPAEGAQFDLPFGGALSIPVSFTGTSLSGGITALTATLNGDPLSVGETGLGTLVANGASTLSITVPGTYSLSASATNGAGLGTDSITFQVNALLPPPSVTILTPENGLIVRRFVDDPASVVDFSFVAMTDAGAITEITTALNGQNVPATFTGIGTKDAGGIGSFSTTTPGDYTITVTARSGGGVASAQVTVRVVEDTRPPADQACGAVTWLTPISLNKPVREGSTLPIRFQIRCKGDRVVDPEVVLVVYEVLPGGGSGPSQFFTWGDTPNGSNYKYTGNHYHHNYRTPAGARTFRAEVYRPVTPGSSVVGLLDSIEFNTVAKGNSGKSDKSKKSEKSKKSGKSGKSDKDDCSEKSKKSDKKSGKSDKSSGVGNPGNDKPVGKAGETPNGDADWGSGSKGKSDAGASPGKSGKAGKSGKSKGKKPGS